jgi:hypothetical protein
LGCQVAAGGAGLFVHMILPNPISTSTPTPAPASPLPSGWRDHVTESFALTLPEEWEAIDLEKDTIEALLELLKSLDVEWARNVIRVVSDEAFQERLKFWAMDTKPAGAGYASANVTYESSPFAVRIGDLCVTIPSVYRRIGFEVLDKQCGLKVNQLDVARFTIEAQLGPFTTTQYQYFYVQGRNVWILTLSVDSTLWTEYHHLFETIAESFRLVPQ